MPIRAPSQSERIRLQPEKSRRVRQICLDNTAASAVETICEREDLSQEAAAAAAGVLLVSRFSGAEAETLPILANGMAVAPREPVKAMECRVDAI